MNRPVTDLRHRIVAGIAAVSLCAGAASEVDARMSSGTSSPLPTASIVARMTARLDEKIGADAAQEALQQKQRLLGQSVLVRFASNDRSPQPPATRISLADHPDWIVFDEQRKIFTVSERSVRYFIDDADDAFLPRAVSAVALPQENDPLRMHIEGTPKAGYLLETIPAAQVLIDAFNEGRDTVRIPVTYQDPSVLLLTDTGFEKLILLSHGVSDFTGSPLGRASNVRKALNDQLNGVLIAPGNDFSFNDAMRDNTGWSDALVIGPGGILVAEPGGGICQAATTVFRAALLAGLPVTERANHSLYVTYYEKYGVGIDATVYAGKQDLAFTNDTGVPMVMLAGNNGSEAHVDLYGIPDGRTAALKGPYFASSSAEEPLFAEKPLRINQIGWKYEVTFADGTQKQEPIVSTYKAIPKRLKAEFAKRSGTGMVVYAAPM
jgi:hypothetical protein